MIKKYNLILQLYKDIQQFKDVSFVIKSLPQNKEMACVLLCIT